MYSRSQFTLRSPLAFLFKLMTQYMYLLFRSLKYWMSELDPVFEFQGAKRPQVSKYSKLKKKLGWGTSEENLNMADDSMSRETKRSKKGGGVESKRHKWRTPKEKSVNFAEISEFDTVSELPVPVDVHTSQSRERDFIDAAPPMGTVSVSGSSGKSYNSTASGHLTDSDDPTTSVNHVTVYEGPSTPRVPPKSYSSRVPDYVNVGSVRKDDCFSSILVPDLVIMVSVSKNAVTAFVM